MFILAVVCLAASALAKDLTVGDGGELIYNQNITASPTVWVRAQNVTIDAPEVITRIIVIDNREDKNGQVAIIEGGVGHNNVTIELKSPAVFRGFYFEIQVYAKPVPNFRIPSDTVEHFIDTTLGQDTKVNENKVHKDTVDVSVKDTVSPVPTSYTTQLPAIQESVPVHQQTEEQKPLNHDIQQVHQQTEEHNPLNHDNQQVHQQTEEQKPLTQTNQVNPIAKDSEKQFEKVDVTKDIQTPAQHPITIDKDETQQVHVRKVMEPLV